MYVLVANIYGFRYFLRFDESYENAYAEGLIQNGSVVTESMAKILIETFESFWPLSIEKI